MCVCVCVCVCVTELHKCFSFCCFCCFCYTGATKEDPPLSVKLRCSPMLRASNRLAHTHIKHRLAHTYTSNIGQKGWHTHVKHIGWHTHVKQVKHRLVYGSTHTHTTHRKVFCFSLLFVFLYLHAELTLLVC